MKIADLSVDLYPGLDRTHAYKGLLLIISGERGKGKEALERSIGLNGNGLASPASLNNFAYTLERIGKQNVGFELLKIAIELYPRDAILHDSLADFYAKKEMKDKAIEFYQKALALDAGYPNAAKAKEILQQLTSTK
jgi:tetratricopeptide (TPR) repeat protein